MGVIDDWRMAESKDAQPVDYEVRRAQAQKQHHLLIDTVFSSTSVTSMT
jgi:hypothetical protein